MVKERETGAVRYRVWSYFALALLLTWAVYLTQYLRNQGWSPFALPAELGVLGPSVAALLLARAPGGPGLRHIFSKLIAWRVSVKWYVVTMLIPAVLAGGSVVIHYLFGGKVPDFGSALPIPIFVFLSIQIVAHLVGEETGWRGYALPGLLMRFSPLMSSLILGFFWSAWHLPLFYLPGPQQGTQLVPFTLSIIPSTILMSWLYLKTDGSVLIAAIFHAANNTAAWYFGTPFGEARLFWISIGLTWLFTTVVVIRGEGFLASPKNLPLELNE